MLKPYQREENKMKKKLSAFQIIKIIIQLISFLLLPGLFIDSFNGIKALVQGLWRVRQILPPFYPHFFRAFC